MRDMSKYNNIKLIEQYNAKNEKKGEKKVNNSNHNIIDILIM